MTFFSCKTSKVLFAVVFLFFSKITYAATYTWNKTTGTHNWNDAANWDLGAVPGATDDVVIGLPTATGSVIVMPSGTVTLKSISVTGNTTYRRTLNMTGCMLVINGDRAFFNCANLTSSNPSTSGVTITATDKVTINICTWDAFETNITNNNTTRNDSGTGTDQAVYINSSTFNGLLTSESRTLRFSSNVFYADVKVTKSGFGGSAEPATLNALNTYHANVECIHNDAGVLSWGNGDVFNGTETIFRNNLNSPYYIGYRPNATTTFTGQYVRFYNEGSGLMTICHIASTTMNFTGDASDSLHVFVYRNGSGTVYLGYEGTMNLNYCNVVIGGSGSGNTAIGASTSSKPVNLETTSTLTTYSAAAAVRPNYPVYTSGGLVITRLKAKGTTTGRSPSDPRGVPRNVSLRFASGGLSFGASDVYFERDLDVEVGGLTKMLGLFKGKCTLQNFASSGNNITGSSGGTLEFQNDVTFTNHASFYWYFGSGVSTSLGDITFNSLSNDRTPQKSLVTVHNEGTGVFALGYQHVVVNVNNVNLKLLRQSVPPYTVVPGNIGVAYTNGSTVNIDVDTEVIIEQSSNAQMIFGGTNGAVNLYGTINASAMTGGYIYLNRLRSWNDLTIDVPAAPTVAAYVQLNLALNVFEKDLKIIAPNIVGVGGLFKGKVEFHKRGSLSANNTFTGSPTFQDDVIIKNETNSTFYFGNLSTDVFTFQKNLTIVQPSPYTTGARLAMLGIANLYGDLTYDGKLSSTLFGASGGLMTFTGNKVNQTISSTDTSAFRIGALEVDKSAGKLIIASDVQIMKSGSSIGVLRLKNGNVVSSTSIARPTVSKLRIGDNANLAAVNPGGGRHSFIEGPVTKEGNDLFKFHIGKSDKYFPLSISAPSVVNSSYTVEFFDQTQPNSTAFTGTLKDAINCQYWKVDKYGSSAAINLTLFWNNDPLQSCYPINHNTVCVARYNSSNWVNEGNTIVNDYQPADSGYVRSATSLTNFGYFALGYRNALVINTIASNPTLFKILNHTEPLPAPAVFTSGPSGTAAGDKTMLSAVNDVAGKIVVHPDFSETLDLQIDQSYSSGSSVDPKADAQTYEVQKLKLYTNAEAASPACTLVTAQDDDLSFNPLSDKYYSKSGSYLTFYKQRQEDNHYILTNSLADGITFPVLATGTVPFQITNVPVGATALLTVKDLAGATVYTTSINPLTWDGKISGVNAAEGVYPYELTLTVSSTPYMYKGQLIVKHQ